MHRAVRIDQGNETIVLRTITTFTVVHGKNQVTFWIKGTTLREMKAAIHFDIGRHGDAHTCLIDGTDRLTRLKLLGCAERRSQQHGTRCGVDQTDS